MQFHQRGMSQSLSTLKEMSEAAMAAPDRARIVELVRVFVVDQPDTLGDGDCESLHPGFFSQPVNTVTSMSYALAGAWVCRRVVSVNPSHRIPLSGFAGLMVLNGIGSVAYHGPQFPGAQTLHDVPAVGLAMMGIAVPLWRRLRGGPSAPGLTRRRGATLGALGGVAALSYIEGRTASRVCDPNSWVQFHGLWHLSTAAAMVTVAGILWPDESGAADSERRSDD